MAKKKPKMPAATETDRHVTPRVVFHLPGNLLAALDRTADQNDRTRTAEIIRAIREHLQREGTWPPQGGGE